MKYTIAILAAAIAQASSTNVNMEICSDSVNNFGIKDINLPEFLVAGETVKVEFNQVPNQYIGKGKVSLELDVEGVKVLAQSFELCQVTECHVQPHLLSQSGLELKLPQSIPAGFDTNLKIVVNNHNGELLSCMDVSGIKVQKTQQMSERHVQLGEASLNKEELEFMFNSWAKEYGMNFKPEIFHHRARIFADNLERVARHNADKTNTYSMAMNEFGHLTADEFAENHFGYSGNKPNQSEGDVAAPRTYFDIPTTKLESTLPAEVDWTKKGAVTPVKNQGSCGSCWSFSTTGALEGAYFLKYGKLVSFSEQELVSCDHVDQGCNGGLMDNADAWIKANGGLCTESDYPYASGSGFAKSCRKNKCSAVAGSQIKSFVDVGHTEADLEAAVAKQPVAIAIEADQLAFQFYSRGVLTGRCGAALDHGVLLVGYGTWSNGKKYWKVKNSWGGSWGMSGYILLERGKPVRGGECGLLLQASYPVL